MTIGDVLAAIAAIFAIGATWAAAILLVALAFPARAERAQEKLVSSPGASLARGLGVTVLFLLVAGALGRHPVGPVRLIAALLWAGLGLLTALGSAGIARLLGERIQAAGSSLPPFAALTRGTIVYVIAGFLPVIGWFLLAPIALLLSVGSAAAALRPLSVRPLTERPEVIA